MSGLRWWLLGLVEPGGIASPTFDASQHLTGVQQDGWNVTLKQYTLFDNYELPTSIVVESELDKEHERYLRAKLIVKDWKIQDPSSKIQVEK